MMVLKLPKLILEKLIKLAEFYDKQVCQLKSQRKLTKKNAFKEMLCSLPQNKNQGMKNLS